MSVSRAFVSQLNVTQSRLEELAEEIRTLVQLAGTLEERQAISRQVNQMRDELVLAFDSAVLDSLI
jgi:gamma-glutamyl phosphate reductase